MIKRHSPSRSILLTLAMIMSLGAIGWGSRVYLQNQQRKEALRLVQAKQFDEAYPLLQSALERDPHDVALIRLLVRGRTERGPPDAETRELLDRWCLLALEQREPFELRLQFARLEGELGMAYHDARHLAELAPDDLEYRRQFAGMAFSTARYAEAESACRDVLRTRPQDATTQRLLAEVMRATGRPNEALTMFAALFQANLNDFASAMGQGALLVELGRGKEAVPLLRQVLRNDPTRQRTVRYQLALALEQAGERQEAETILAELRALQDAEVLGIASTVQPKNVDLQFRSAAALFAAGQRKEAVLQLLHVVQLDPTHREAHRLLAQHYEEVSDAGRAAEHRRQANAP